MTSVQETINAEIARQNDEFRRSYGQTPRVPGQIVMTQGVAAFDALVLMNIQSAIILFNAFSNDNDPYGLHDFGEITVKVSGVDTKVWFKIDLYDVNYDAGSEKSDDTALPRRVMTILLPSEY
ncbi:DUF3768 domain-containing protein [Loktanella sp. S4079]|uniref:DUF3768 domain-containing protein n=1 Tax=Loktanella sp. S4079 TaxID=579483 RepID=UPI0005FA3CCC|nr:DUF3768 domain-containing protein [Loktanella sp. S4079]KJZ17913.1 hypothetical protein TW80_16365 [Loktanella sp. S4079]